MISIVSSILHIVYYVTVMLIVLMLVYQVVPSIQFQVDEFMPRILKEETISWLNDASYDLDEHVRDPSFTYSTFLAQNGFGDSKHNGPSRYNAGFEWKNGRLVESFVKK